jgi:hypothetical protein
VGYLVVELYSSHTKAAQQEVLKQYVVLHYCPLSHKQKEQRKQITEEGKGKIRDKET